MPDQPTMPLRGRAGANPALNLLSAPHRGRPVRPMRRSVETTNAPGPGRKRGSQPGNAIQDEVATRCAGIGGLGLVVLPLTAERVCGGPPLRRRRDCGRDLHPRRRSADIPGDPAASDPGTLMFTNGDDLTGGYSEGRPLRLDLQRAAPLLSGGFQTDTASTPWSSRYSRAHMAYYDRPARRHEEPPSASWCPVTTVLVALIWISTPSGRIGCCLKAAQPPLRNAGEALGGLDSSPPGLPLRRAGTARASTRDTAARLMQVVASAVPGLSLMFSALAQRFTGLPRRRPR